MAKARADELTAVAGSLLLYSAVRDGGPFKVGAAAQCLPLVWRSHIVSDPSS